MSNEKKFQELTAIDEINSYIENKTLGHNNFYHYTSLSIIDNILKNKEIWISNVSVFNDTVDKDQFPKSEYNFALCFSTGKTENISLWYMYAGIDGHGGRIVINKNQLYHLLNNSVTYSLYEKVSSEKRAETPICILEKDVTMKLKVKDILYFNEEEGKKRNEEKSELRLKYKDLTNREISISDFNTYKRNNTGFYKRLIWCYEKETRLHIELVGEARKKIETGKNYVIVLFIDDIYDNIKIEFAPEIDNLSEYVSKYDNIKGFIYKDIQKQIFNEEKFSLSKYKGNIKMDLCKKCTKIPNCNKCDKNNPAR